MQVVWPLLAAMIACSAPGKPLVEAHERVDDLGRVIANDCPNTKLYMWTEELFPACGRFPVGTGLPICRGSTCERACGMSVAGFQGAMGHEQLELSELYTYDERGRFLNLSYGGTQYVSCEYDGEYRARCTMPSGDDTPRTRSVTRDASGRIVSLNSGDDRLPLTYDAQGRVTAIGDEVFAYDDHGWLVQMGQTRYEHDAEGHVMTETRGDSVVHYEYRGDRLVRMRGPGEHRNQSFEYDDAGRLVRIARGGLEDQGVSSTFYSYDCKR